MTNKKHFNSLIDPEEIYHSVEEDKWWKRGAYAVAILFFGYIMARGLVTMIFGV